MGNGPFAKKHGCRISVICHCLSPGPVKFFQCCGWYCTKCEGRNNSSPPGGTRSRKRQGGR